MQFLPFVDIYAADFDIKCFKWKSLYFCIFSGKISWIETVKILFTFDRRKRTSRRDQKPGIGSEGMLWDVMIYRKQYQSRSFLNGLVTDLHDWSGAGLGGLWLVGEGGLGSGKHVSIFRDFLVFYPVCPALSWLVTLTSFSCDCVTTHTTETPLPPDPDIVLDLTWAFFPILSEIKYLCLLSSWFDTESETKIYIFQNSNRAVSYCPYKA